jgi:mono/diheme cytochrome c family protein
MMKPRLTAYFFAFAALACPQTSAKKPASALATRSALAAKYCAGCHNDTVKAGSMTLTSLDLAHPWQNADLAEKVIRKVRAGMMPPAGMPRPSLAEMNAFAASLENTIDAQAAAHPNPGRPALHRLNRTEYANSIHDLLDLNVDAAALLPVDDMSHGFDNMSDVLTVTPALMDGYIRAAGKISRQAIGDPHASPAMVTYRIPRVISQMRHVEGTPFGTRGGISIVHNFPADGEYSFKMIFYASLDGPLFGRNQGKGQQIEISINGARVALLDIDPNLKSTGDLRTPPIKIKGGPQRVAAAFIQKFDGPLEDDVMPIELSLADLNNAAFPGVTSLPHLSDFSISGPFNPTGISDTPSREKVFICRPEAGADELPCARKIISKLARQAYRRPVSEADLEDLLGFYQQGRNKSDFEAGITTALQAIISSPEFVFRFERTPPGVAPGANYRISDLELASRLSYFLWSSAPDEQLIALAGEGKLSNPVTLDRQVRRMLADPRSEALSSNFASEWLHLQNLRPVQPDAFLFPNFDKNLALSMQHETQLFFDSIMREDRNVLDLLTANYTYVDELLAKHYGIPNVLGSRFRRVELTDDNRRGLLGQGSILTMTSISNRTSPVARGKYVMEVLLGTPPPSPPPNVPPLKESADTGKILSVREKMEEHRANAVCAACHKMMDPIGFALENYDAVGVWRTKDSGFPIDATGQMFDGAKLDGPASLRQAILNHKDSFLGSFTENLLSYAAGRVLEPSDMPAVRAIAHQAARNNNHFSSYIMGVVQSAPFRMRRAEAPEPVRTDAILKPKESQTNVHH